MMRGVLGLLFLAGAAHAADMTVVRYLDRDPGDPAYATRILVAPGFLRMDGGEDDGDFVLLDRRAKTVVNVMRDSGLAMRFVAASAPAKRAQWRAALDTRPAAPGTLAYRLVVNGVACSEGVLAPKAHPEVARALAELKAVLAATQYRVWQDSPRALQHDCDLANEVWEFDGLLKQGLPLETREFSGRTRAFERASRETLRPELFRIPEGLTAIDAPS